MLDAALLLRQSQRSSSYTKGVYLGRHSGGEQYKDRESLIRAFKKISSFIRSFDWKVKIVVYDGERAMGTNDFLLMVGESGAIPIPLPKGRKAQRFERKQGYIKSQARVLKTIFPTSLPWSLVPHLAQASIWQTNTNICKGNPGDIPPLLALERVPSFSFDRVYSPVFADIVLSHREDAVLDKTEDYTSEAIALYPADTQEEGYYFYIPRTKGVVKRATFTKCEVYTENIIRALLRQ